MKKKNKNDKKIQTKLIKNTNEDTGEVFKFAIILICVALVAVLLYFLSSKYLIKDGVEKEEDPTEESIDYTYVTGGTLFNRPLDTYYVLAYDSESDDAPKYKALANNVDEKKGTIYLMDLSNELNQKFVGEKSNEKATQPSELSLTDPTLIKIKDGKISKYWDTVSEIEKELK